MQIAAIFYALMLCTYTFACSCSLLTTIIIQPVLKLMTRPQPVAILPSSEHHLDGTVFTCLCQDSEVIRVQRMCHAYF